MGMQLIYKIIVMGTVLSDIRYWYSILGIAVMLSIIESILQSICEELIENPYTRLSPKLS